LGADLVAGRLANRDLLQANGAFLRRAPPEPRAIVTPRLFRAPDAHAPGTRFVAPSSSAAERTAYDEI